MRITTIDVRILKESKLFLENNPQEKLQISDLCENFNIKRTKLIYGFRVLFNETIYHYHLRVKMEYAMQQLKNGAQVKEIAIDLQYASSSSFSRAFRLIHGHVPEHYKCY